MGTNNRAFARAKAMMAAIHAIMVAGGSIFDKSDKIAALGEYKSRGHGGRYRANGSRPVNGTSGAPSGKYHPHQGTRECARRVAKMNLAGPAHVHEHKKKIVLFGRLGFQK